MNAQELLDKYIKYNSKITFDIFKLMYQKLIDLGFTSPHTVENAFKEFSGKYPCFIMKSYTDGPFFNQHTCNSINQSEISVEDLLGYNPFGYFKLPEKWYIEVGENDEIINKWKQTTEYTDPASKYKYVTCRGSGYYRKSDYTDHSEITIEQFKQYVLKEPLIPKPIKPFPAQWCIELNKETIPIVGVYYNKKHLSDPECDTYTGDGAIGYYVKSHNVENEYIKNGYTSCSFFDFGKPSDLYPEITLEQFKEFVMNEPVKIETISESKVEESVPEYVECFYSDTDSFIINKIYKCEPLSSPNNLSLNSEIGIKKSLPYKGGLWQFKPSTKEAFEAQNKPKSIEKWSVGSYIVPLQDKLLTRDEPLIKGKLYQIIKRINLPYIICENGSEINFFDNSNAETTEGIKWFATKSKAEEFAKTLIDPVKEVIQLTEFPIEGRCKYDKRIEDLLRKNHLIYESSRTVKIDKVKFICWNSEKYWYTIDSSSKKEYLLTQLESFLIKQPLKQAVHCKTQEEWDFVGEKIGYKFKTTFDSAIINTINPSTKTCNARSYYEFKSTQYQILSFQEWCDLNEYKMKKTRFKAGDYVVSLRPENLSTYNIKFNYCYIQYKDEDEISIESGATMYETDFNYARLATPKEIEEYRRIGKPYDVTTLQSPTINTYGLNIGDTLDQDIICKWSGNAKNRYSSGETSQWTQGIGFFCGDRVIKSFKVIDNVVGFLVSGTNNVYLRADGFKEFADNYYTKITSNFKVGSWYKSTAKENNRGGETYYGKFLSYDNGSFTATWHSVANNFTEQVYTFSHEYKWELMTDLSEIQQYLPDGHPDKIVKNPIFEVGKWYKNLGTCNNVYGKFSKLDNPNQFWISEYIYKNEYSKDSGWFFYSSDTVECSLEEIQEFLPEGHPNKFIRLNGTPMEIKIETNSFYGTALVQKFQSDKEEIYLLPDPD